MRVFIGSSQEALAKDLVLTVAGIVEQKNHTPICWNDHPSIFHPGMYILEVLDGLTEKERIDAAIFLFSHDDTIWYRGKEAGKPRDNVIFEHGLFLGKLGRNRSIILKCDDVDLPTDLSGITYINFSENARHNGALELNKWLERIQDNLASENECNNKSPLEEIIAAEKENISNNLVHISELEKLESDFCRRGGTGARIVVVTNDLTCDMDHFLEEITKNIEMGVIYTYIVPPEKKEDAEELKNKANERTGDLDRFDVIVEENFFTICPQKYTVLIYYGGQRAKYDPDLLRVFCSAQDTATKTNIFFFEMSEDHAKEYKKKIFEKYSLKEKPNVIEYKPWSEAVLKQCIEDSNKGLIPTLDLELTAKCSHAHCIYCDSKPGVSEHEVPNELNYSKLKEITLEAKKRGLKWVYTCGLGEPMETKYFRKYIRFLKDNNIKFSMFTNGLRIQNLETAKLLKECNVNVVLKVDTFDEKKYDVILGKKGAAKKIYRARDLLLEAGYGADAKGKTDLAFSIVPTTFSFDGIAEVLSFCEKKGIYASIGELEQAGEVLRNNRSDQLGLSTKQVKQLKSAANKYLGTQYRRPICPCIMNGIHIDNFGNCVVDRESGLNCKWFLLKEPSVVNLGNVNEKTIKELHEAVTSYRNEAFKNRADDIHASCRMPIVFGGCGGNPKDIIQTVEKKLSP